MNIEAFSSTSCNFSVTDNDAIIGYNDREQAKKAYWFNVSGVGKSRKLWKFLGITQEQKDKLIIKLGKEHRDIVVQHLGDVIRKTRG